VKLHYQGREGICGSLHGWARSSSRP